MTWLRDNNTHSITKTLCDEAEAKGRENFYASYELSDNPYSKNTKQFLAWAYGFLDAKDESVK